MILRECVEAKYHAQEKHFKQAHGSFAAYTKLAARKYEEMQKAREAKAGVPEGFVPLKSK